MNTFIMIMILIREVFLEALSRISKVLDKFKWGVKFTVLNIEGYNIVYYEYENNRYSVISLFSEANVPDTIDRAKTVFICIDDIRYDITNQPGVLYTTIYPSDFKYIELNDITKGIRTRFNGSEDISSILNGVDEITDILGSKDYSSDDYILI